MSHKSISVQQLQNMKCIQMSGVKVSKIVSLTDDLGFSISGKRYSDGSTDSGEICDWNRGTKFGSGHCFIAGST